MSEKVKDGGPAFPVVQTHVGYDRDAEEIYPDVSSSGGMSLRDYFAAKAMQAELLTCGVPGQAADCLCAAAGREGRTVELQMAHNAYDMADAMLAARESTP